MEGQLSEHPLAELIREINNTGLSGALRLSHDRAKVVVYFDAGICFSQRQTSARTGCAKSSSAMASRTRNLINIPRRFRNEELALALVKSQE